MSLRLGLATRPLISGALLLLTASAAHAQAGPYQQAQTAFAAKQYAQAAELAQKAEAAAPGTTPALLLQGKALAQLGRLGEAESALRRYLDRDMRSSDALYVLGLVLQRENRPRDSLAVLQQAAALSTPSADELNLVAIDYVLLDDYPSAIKWLEKAVSFDAGNAEAWYSLGRCYYTQSRFLDAEKAFQRTLTLQPRHVKAANNLGLVYEAQNKSEAAAKQYQDAIAWQQDSPRRSEQPYLNYGKLLTAQNRPQDAISQLKQAVEVAPGSAVAHQALGKAYVAAGDAGQAVSELQKAVSLDSGNPALHFELGRAYRQAGMQEQARSELEMSQKLYGSKSKRD